MEQVNWVFNILKTIIQIKGIVLNIKFPNSRGICEKTGGINFLAIVDNKNIVCTVSLEVLDKVDTDKTKKIKQKFEDNKILFENIAERKIESGELDISIRTTDID